MTLNIPTPNPAVDVDGRLRFAIDPLRADLVVTASHSGHLAAHASVSVMVVREQPAGDTQPNG
ncbi:hypothetical protein [Roseovarius pelagicus]|uniref:Uncharacterized protein n=1 Tax=Roseovarius pelagicus TaxID=2980108 RepID=A0ABY6DM47_9RHOB|nr:hypothetical protein [Roseovarius pelagicus]UXX84845.1 hypothetical protein N7U68_09485 [Roseovarius pelagicus]